MSSSDFFRVSLQNKAVNDGLRGGIVYGYPLTAENIVKMVNDADLTRIAKEKGYERAVYSLGESTMNNVLYKNNRWTKKEGIRLHVKEAADRASYKFILGVKYQVNNWTVPSDYSTPYENDLIAFGVSFIEENLTPGRLYNQIIENGVKNFLNFDKGYLRTMPLTEFGEKLRMTAKNDIADPKHIIERDGHTAETLWKHYMSDLGRDSFLALIDLADLIDIMYTAAGIEEDEDIPQMIATYVDYEYID